MPNHKNVTPYFDEMTTYPYFLQVLIEGFDPVKFRAANTMKKSKSLDNIELTRRKSTG